MNDALFRGLISTSLAYNNVQNNRITGELGRLNQGVENLGQSMEAVQGQVTSLTGEMQAAREQQRVQGFWKENIFVIKKGMEKSLATVHRFPHAALYLAESFGAFMKQEGMTSRNFEQISDKEYWSSTCDLRDELVRQATARLPPEEVQAVRKVVIIQQVRSPLNSLIAWKRAYPILRSWWDLKKSLPSANNFKRKVLLKVHHFFKSLSTASIVVVGLPIMFSIPVFLIALWGAFYGNPNDRSNLMKVVIGLPVCVAILFFALKLLEKFTKNLAHKLEFVPEPPAAAVQIIRAAGWDLHTGHSESSWREEVSGFVDQVTRHAEYVRENDSLESLQSMLREYDDHLEAYPFGEPRGVLNSN